MYLPIIKRKAVMIAPGQICFHSVFLAGTILNISANKIVVTHQKKTILTPCIRKRAEFE
jgi:hypothetical protein